MIELQQSNSGPATSASTPTPGIALPTAARATRRQSTAGQSFSGKAPGDVSDFFKNLLESGSSKK